MKGAEVRRSSSEELLHSLDDAPQGLFGATVGSVLEGLELLYAAGLNVYLKSEKVGLRHRTIVPVPVISVGNLSVGGTGKTPVTILLGKALQQLGLKVAVLSRGHGGSASRSTGVVSDGTSILLTAAESGDEPMLLAWALPGIPVLVGKDRRATARLAVKNYSPDLILLDDGLQYWQLNRDVDIVLLDARKPLDNGHCLPRGLLREPKENLSRAEFVLVTRSFTLNENDKENLKQRIAALAPKSKVYFSQHVGGECIPCNSAAIMTTPSDVLALCGIGKPESFLETLQIGGVSVTATMFVPDHYRYSLSDVDAIIRKMKEFRAKAIVTTQKDYVKLKEILPDVPVFVQQVQVHIEDETGFIMAVLRSAGLPVSVLEASAAEC